MANQASLPFFKYRFGTVKRLIVMRIAQLSGAGKIIMGGLQIGNILNLMEANSSFNADKARREVLDYLNGHMTDVVSELEEKGEAVIQTPSGVFRLTKDDLFAAA